MKTIIGIGLLLGLVSCGAGKNEDNTVYQVGRQFFYNTTYVDSKGEVEKVDRLEMQVTDGFYPSTVQTEIVWKHYQSENGDTVLYTNETGVEDSPEQFFIHPPRVGDLYILSFAEFPLIKRACIQNPDVELQTSAIIAMSKQYQGVAITSVSANSKYLGITKTKIPYFDQPVDVYHIEADATCEIGTINGHYYFHKTLGFVKLDYTLPDNSQIKIDLTGTNFVQSNGNEDGNKLVEVRKSTQGQLTLMI